MSLESEASVRSVSRKTWGGLILVAAISVGMMAWVLRPHQELPFVKRAGDRLSREQVVEVGGVKRPITDIRRPADRPKRQSDDSILQNALPRLPIDKTKDPQVASAIEAISTGKHPERVSSLVAPPKFDRAAYDAKPQGYLNICEPGRVWQVAQPGPGIPRLTSLVPELHSIEQGESVSLKVQVTAGAPVTFTSFDLGAFSNQLTSITVAADKQGIARATFTGTGGTTGEVQILAGSPMTAGQAQFLINVAIPKSPRSTAKSGSSPSGGAAKSN